MNANPTRAEVEAYEARLILADVLEALDEVDDAWASHIGTHYEGCHVWHVIDRELEPGVDPDRVARAVRTYLLTDGVPR